MPQLLLNRPLNSYGGAYNLDTLIKAHLDTDTLSEIIAILPTSKQVRQLTQSIVRRYFAKYKRPCGKLRIYTLSDFINICHRAIPGDAPMRLSEPNILLLFEEAIRNSSLQYFSGAGSKVSLSMISKLASIISGLRSDGLFADDIIAESSDNPDVKNPLKLSDIGEIAAQYQALLRENNLADQAVVVGRCIEYFSKSVRLSQSEMFGNDDLFLNVFPEIKNILFQGFSFFRLPEADFLATLTRTTINVCINLDYSPNNGPLFGNLEENIARLSDQGYHLISDDKDLPEKSRALFLRRHLFNVDKRDRTDDLKDMVHIMGFQTLQDETRFVSKMIRKLILKDGLKPSEICVATRQPGKYAHDFRDRFTADNIPGNITDRPPLSNSPVVNSIFIVPELIAGGWRVQDMQKLVSSRFIRITLPGFNGNNLFSAARKFRIEGGLFRGAEKNWTKTLEEKIDFLNYAIETGAISSDELDIHNMNRDLKMASDALNDFNKLIDFIGQTSKSFTADQFRSLIHDDIIEKFQLREKLSDEYKEVTEKRQRYNSTELIKIKENIEFNARSLTRFIAVLDEFCDLLKRRSKTKKYELSTLIEKLKISVSAEKNQIKEKQDFGVTVTSIEQTRGMLYKAVILCGAVDGDFPLAFRPETFLGQSLNQSEKRHKNNERMLFYQFLTNSAEYLENGSLRIYITYPRSVDSRDKVRSSFIDSLMSITNLEECNFDEENISDSIADMSWAEINNSITNIDEISEHVVSHPELIEKYKAQLPDYFNDYIEQTTKDVEAGPVEYTGDIQAPGQDYAFSITELEQYIKCPFQYYAQRVLKLEAEEQADQEIGFLELGNLSHLVLYSFYTELAERDRLPAEENELPEIIRLDESRKQEYKELLRDTADRIFSQFADVNPYIALQKEEYIGNNDGIFFRWLDLEIERHKHGYYFPAMFEFGFGLPSASGRNLGPVKLHNELILKGKADRIEFSTDYQSFLVADYKSQGSSLPSKKKIKEGLAFQMPLYLIAIRHIIESNYNIETEPHGGIYFVLKKNAEYEDDMHQQHSLLCRYSPEHAQKKTKYSEVLTSKESLEDILAMNLDSAVEVTRNIRRGYFPAAPLDDKYCIYCDYGHLCRYNIQRDTAGAEE